MNRHTKLRTVTFALIALLPALTGCVQNDVIGRSQLIGLTRSEEVALGIQAQPGMISEMGGKVNDASLQAYVAEVGRSLASKTEGDNPGLPWEFTLLDSPQINAFALPGGKVFISRGLAAKMSNEAQLASVLGHEVGHVTARHTAERFGQANATNLGMQVGAAVLGSASVEVQQFGGLALNLGGQLVPLKFSREQELEADGLGMRYMVKANYNPTGALQVMQILAQESGGGGGGLTSLLATHPDPELRAQKITEALRGPYAQYVNNPAYELREQAFRQRMTSRLTMLAPAGESRVAFAPFANPSSWCAHCREMTTR